MLDAQGNPWPYTYPAPPPVSFSGFQTTQQSGPPGFSSFQQQNYTQPQQQPFDAGNPQNNGWGVTKSNVSVDYNVQAETDSSFLSGARPVVIGDGPRPKTYNEAMQYAGWMADQMGI